MASPRGSTFEGQTVRVDSDSLVLEDELGSGKEGTVYRIQGSSSDVVKIFAESYRTNKEEKVRAMIDNEPDDPTFEKIDIRSIIWPQAVVENPKTGEFLGYMMPYKDLNEAVNAFQYSIEELDWNASSKEERFTTARNLAIMVEAIHNEGHAIGDFNHDNILIDDGVVTLIDCDGFHITDGADRFPDYTYYPRYAPPEGRGDTLEEVQEADRFSLGVHIFQFLMEGFHPYQAKGPEAGAGNLEELIQENKYPYEYSGYEPHDKAPSYAELPGEVRALFDRCFNERNKVNEDLYATGRPEPHEWIAAFDEATSAKEETGSTDETDAATPTGATSPEDRTDGPKSSSTRSPAESGIRRGHKAGINTAQAINAGPTSGTTKSGGTSSTTKPPTRPWYLRKTWWIGTARAVASETKRTLVYLGGFVLLALIVLLFLSGM